MYKPSRGGNRGSRKAGRYNDRNDSANTNNNNAGAASGFSVLGATVISIETHPKQPYMYRVALKLKLDESEPETRSQTDFEIEKTEQVSSDWSDEVDALIAGAQSMGGLDEALLTVHEDTLVSWRLLKGRELSAEEYAKLKEDEQKEDAYRVALAMLERKARTTAEMSRALKRKGYVPDVVAGCLERLQARGMLDDSAYAKRFTEQRAIGQSKGRMLIKQELLQRGVRREDAEQAIGELDGQIEQESCFILARKRWPNIKGNDRERKQKLMAMLLRRGYPSGVVRSAIQQVASEFAEPEYESDFDESDPFDSEYLDD
ncbi:regulatory protein RecX [Cohnella silvisoli]|uniref:Regulatory protein RecX n=1 Tax=Cohnella silvisoli TaxID=2873699 RepID=A0ABV1KVA9_9BACL|nr:regulatory protein RecX [Cohnella silvisoli]MCD9023437.1 recombination regulator RecX [Cohnella silvisoli]